MSATESMSRSRSASGFTAGKAPNSANGRGSSHAVALLDLQSAVVDGGQHLRRVAGHDDVYHRRAVALFHALPKRSREGLGVFDPDPAAAHDAGDRRVIHLVQIGRLI